MSDDKKAADVEDHFGFLCDVGHSPRLGGSRLGIPIRTESPVPGLIAFLKHKQMLIVLDSCEHVIGAVAQLVEQVLNAAPGVHILATSRSFPKFAANSTASRSPSSSLRVSSILRLLPSKGLDILRVMNYCFHH
jgi:hypothetical protein